MGTVIKWILGAIFICSHKGYLGASVVNAIFEKMSEKWGNKASMRESDRKIMVKLEKKNLICWKI